MLAASILVNVRTRCLGLVCRFSAVLRLLSREPSLSGEIHRAIQSSVKKQPHSPRPQKAM